MTPTQYDLGDYAEDTDFRPVAVAAVRDAGDIRVGERFTAVRRYTGDGREPLLKLKNSEWVAKYEIESAFAPVE